MERNALEMPDRSGHVKEIVHVLGEVLKAVEVAADEEPPQ